MSAESFDLSQTFIHLGLGATAIALPDFEWSPDYLSRYEADHAADGADGRLVCISAETTTWDSWERHPAGEEVVVLLSGRIDLVQEVEAEERVVAMSAGRAVINPAGVWHRSVVHEPGQALFITPGRGTEHRPR